VNGGLGQRRLRVASFAGLATFYLCATAKMPTTDTLNVTHTEDKGSEKSKTHFEGTRLAVYECQWLQL
jgi:hypothetical protein